MSSTAQNAPFKKFWTELSAIANVMEGFDEELQREMYNKHFESIPISDMCRIASTRPEFKAIVTEFLSNLFISARARDVDAVGKEFPFPDNENDTDSKVDEKTDGLIERTDVWIALRDSIANQLQNEKPRFKGERWGDYECRIVDKATTLADNQVREQNRAYSAPVRNVAHAQTPMSYANMAVGFPALPNSGRTQPMMRIQPTRVMNTQPTPAVNPVVKPVVTNYKSERVKTTTCERHFADGNCPNGEDCWFLHELDKDDYPINWGPRYGYFTSRRNSQWRHCVASDGEWVHEFSPNGTAWTVKSHDEYVTILSQPHQL